MILNTILSTTFSNFLNLVVIIDDVFSQSVRYQHNHFGQSCGVDNVNQVLVTRVDNFM